MSETDSSSFTLEFALPADDFKTEWRRCNMLANYVADYVSYQFPQRERAENLISTITNELIESVIRLTPTDSPLHLRCIQRPSELVLEMEHSLQSEAQELYPAFLKALEAPDTDPLYLELLTAEQRPAVAFNQLGLVVLVHDFGVHIVAHRQATGRIQTQVVVPTKELVE
jgi:hypothetical protein